MFDFFCWLGLGIFILMCVNYKKHHRKNNSNGGDKCVKDLFTK